MTDSQQKCTSIPNPIHKVSLQGKSLDMVWLVFAKINNTARIMVLTSASRLVEPLKKKDNIVASEPNDERERQTKGRYIKESLLDEPKELVVIALKA